MSTRNNASLHVAESARETKPPTVYDAFVALLELFKHHLKLRLQYRETFLFSLLLHPLVMLLILAMFRGIYAKSDLVLGYSQSQMVWYFGASQFFYYLVWNVVDKNIAQKVMFGGMDQQLTRPYSLMTWEFVQLVAHKLLSLVFEFLPVFLAYWLILRPDFLSLAGLGEYLLLTALALVEFFLLSFLFGLLSFLWHDISATNALKFITVNVLAGVALPIAFFPHGLQRLILALPFHYLFHTPVEYLLGRADVHAWPRFAEVCAAQCAWIALLFALCAFGSRRTIRHFLSAGG
jgi:ABC-2 type transport system permease protein